MSTLSRHVANIVALSIVAALACGGDAAVDGQQAREDTDAAHEVAAIPADSDDAEPTPNLAVPPTPQATVPSARVGTIAGSAGVTDAGAATYTIPIEVPPGIGGIEPSLTLAYSSNGGYGFAGVGWSLTGFSTISRCSPNLRDDGRKGTLRYDDSDPLCLDGVRLVAVDGAHGADLTEYRTRVDQYARIVGHGSIGSPSAWFEVFTKDGRISRYGSTADAHVDYDGTTYIWSLSQFSDRSENTVEYQYEAEVLDFDDGLTSFSAHVDHRPSRIDYTRHATQNPRRAVTFAYEVPRERDITWSRGAPDRRSHRLAEIQTWGPSQALVRSYSLRYEQESVSQRDLLSIVRECDAHGRCKPSTTFTWTLGGAGYEELPEGQGWSGVQWPADAYGEPPYWPYQRVLLDINGDRAQDLLWLFDNAPQREWRFWISEGDGSFSPTPDAGTGTATGIETGVDMLPLLHNTDVVPRGPLTRAQPIAFNADDRDDVAFVSTNAFDFESLHWTGQDLGVLVARPDAETPEQFGFEPLVVQDNSDEPIYQGLFPDLDGDGLNDALLCRGPEWNATTWVYALGTTVNPAGSPTTSHAFDFASGGVDTDIRCSPYDEYLLLDADGDGGTDLLVVPAYDDVGDDNVIPDTQRNSYMRLAIDFETPASSLVDSGLPRDRVQRWRHRQHDSEGVLPGVTSGPGIDKLLDLNADGLVDVVRYELASGDSVANMPAILAIFGDDGEYENNEDEDGGWRPWFNTGNGFARGEDFILEFSSRSDLETVVYNAAPIDYNGDGRGDLLMPEPGSPSLVFIDVAVLVAGEESFTLVPTDLGLVLPAYPEQGWRLQTALDVDADASQDLALWGNTSWILHRGLSTYTDLLSTATDGLGKVTTFNWSHTMDPTVHDAHDACQSSERCDRAMRPIVAEMHEDAGLANGQAYERRYHYYGGRSDRDGRGWLGFDRVQVVEAVGPLVRSVSERWFEPVYDAAVDDFPLAGRVAHEIVHHNVALAGEPDRFNVQQVDYEYAARPHPTFAGVHDVVAARVLERHWELDEGCDRSVADVTVCEPDEIPSLWNFASDTTIDEVDEYGNAELITRSIDGDWVDVVSVDYDNDVDAWLLGSATHVVAESTDASGATQAREIEAEYELSTGQLAWTIREPNDPEFWLRTDITRDDYGNVEDVTETDGTLTRTSTTIWNGEGVFPSDTFNALDHHEVMAFDQGLGVPTVHIDPNGVTTLWTYDGFGRVVGQQRRSSTTGPSDGADVTVTYAPVTDPVAAMTVLTAVAGGSRTVDTLDRRGRPIRQDWRGFGGASAFATIDYDGWLQPWRQSLPTYFADPVAGHAIEIRDDMGRPRSRIAPDSSTVNFAYHSSPSGIHTVEQTDEEDNVSVVELDGRGQIVRSIDAMLTETCYEWGSFGNLKEVARNCASPEPPSPIVLDFDAWGQKRALVDDALGDREYSYDAFGRLTETLGPDGEVASYDYDLLDRRIERIDSDGRSSWVWDSPRIGLLRSSASSDGAQRTYSYDSFSRPTTSSLRYDGSSTMAMKRTYDAFNRLDKLTYPNSGSEVVVQHVYDGHGNLDQVRRPSGTVYWDAQTVDAAGRIRAEAFGNGVTTARVYDVLTGRIEALTTTSADTPGQQLEYDWTEAGDLLERRDLLHDQTETLVHDSLHRLASIEIVTPEGPLTDSAEYDALGNFEFQLGVGDFGYTDGKLTSAGPYEYAYDSAGRVVEKNDQLFTWTPQGMLRSITSPTESLGFGYDADGVRVARTSGATDTTLYLDGFYEYEESATTRHKYYIWAAGRVVAEIVRPVGGLTVDSVRYLHDDHLGSTDLITPQNGDIAQGERMSFDAWGRPRNPEDWSESASVAFALGVNVGFTGHMAQRDGGVVNMRGRMYDADVGRFLSPDPYVQAPSDLRSLNRYSYVFNNPLRYVDPSGYQTVISTSITVCSTLGCGNGRGSSGGAMDGMGSAGSGAAGPPSGSGSNTGSSGGDSAGGDRTSGGAALNATTGGAGSRRGGGSGGEEESAYWRARQDAQDAWVLGFIDGVLFLWVLDLPQWPELGALDEAEAALQGLAESWMPLSPSREQAEQMERRHGWTPRVDRSSRGYALGSALGTGLNIRRGLGGLLRVVATGRISGTAPTGPIALPALSESQRASFVSAATQTGRGGTSPIGQAIQSHSSRSGSAFSSSGGNAAQNTAAGRSFLNELFTNPATGVTHRVHPVHGPVVDVRLPSGAGAQFAAEGRFIGLLERYTLR